MYVCMYVCMYACILVEPTHICECSHINLHCFKECGGILCLQFASREGPGDNLIRALTQSHLQIAYVIRQLTVVTVVAFGHRAS